VVEALAGRGELEAAERLASGLKGKEPKRTAEARIANARTGIISRQPADAWSWDQMLAAAEQATDPDDRLTSMIKFITLHMLPADAGPGLLAALLRVRRALTEGGKAMDAAGLDPERVTASPYSPPVHWRGMSPGPERDAAVLRLVRLCRIAGAQALIGNLAAAVATAALVEDPDFRAGTLALLLSGHLESLERQRYAGTAASGRTPRG